VTCPGAGDDVLRLEDGAVATCAGGGETCVGGGVAAWAGVAGAMVVARGGAGSGIER
jgi:hypothetical protein